MKKPDPISKLVLLLVFISLLLFIWQSGANANSEIILSDPNMEQGIYPSFNPSLPSQYVSPGLMGWGVGDETDLPGDGGDERDDTWVDSVLPVDHIPFFMSILFILLYCFIKRYSFKKKKI